MAKRKKQRAPVTVSDQLLAAIDLSEMTNYRISKDTGVDEATLSRFRTGHRGMRLDSFERLCSYFRLELTDTPS